MSQLGRKVIETNIQKEQAPRYLPWSAEQWHLASRPRAPEPEKRYPVIINSSTGLLRTPQELQRLAGLPSLPHVLCTTKASSSDKVEGASRDHDGTEPEMMQYCDVNWEQLLRVQERTKGENVIVWFQGKKRFAWLARLEK